MSRKYKHRVMQAHYNACISSFNAPRDERGELWAHGKRRWGSNARQAFWAGYDGDETYLVPRRTPLWACYMAGKDCAR